jgi:hypothetical protein
MVGGIVRDRAGAIAPAADTFARSTVRVAHLAKQGAAIELHPRDGELVACIGGLGSPSVKPMSACRVKPASHQPGQLDR